MERHSGKEFGIPIIYFTQMMGLAFGFSSTALGMKRLLVDPYPALRTWGFR